MIDRLGAVRRLGILQEFGQPLLAALRTHPIQGKPHIGAIA